MTFPALPQGFLAAGVNAGIKNSKRDLGILVSDRDATFWAALTTNRSRAHNINRTAALLERKLPLRAVCAVSGNANALTGIEGQKDDAAIAEGVARAMGLDSTQVATAATGVIGHRMPTEKVLAGLPLALSQLSSDPGTFTESIMTTDRVPKCAVRDVFIGGQRVRLHGVCKGAGMIAPELATMLCFVTTDADIAQGALRLALESAVEVTFNQLTVDGDTSTNDVVMVMANGAAENDRIEVEADELSTFTKALTELLEELAKAIARDGEGATRLLEVSVTGAYSYPEARVVSMAIANSLLVKAAIFGADPYAIGRILSAAGAAAAFVDAHFDLEKLRAMIQGVVLFDQGAPVKPPNLAALRTRMTEPEVRVEIDLGLGKGTARAWGCDLTYDYVKINADYASNTTPASDGSVSVSERLADFGPSIKKKLLIEALRYISKFDGMRAVIKLGGAAMIDPRLEEEFAEDVLLLQSVGLRPIVVHGGGPEISSLMKRLGHESTFVDGLRVTDKETMTVVEMVLTGSVNQRLVASLNKSGTRGVGISGKDGGLIRARPADRPELGQVGEVAKVDPTLIEILEREGKVPVVSPVGLGPDGLSYNINADWVAAELAVALSAGKLIYMSDVPGLLDGDQVVSAIDGDQLKARIERGDVTGGMLPKLKAALHSLRGGVSSVHLVDGRVPHNLIAELFTDRGVGTLIRRA